MTLKEQKIKELREKWHKPNCSLDKILHEMFDYAIDLAAGYAKVMDYNEDDTPDNWYEYLSYHEAVSVSENSILQLKTKEV